MKTLRLLTLFSLSLMLCSSCEEVLTDLEANPPLCRLIDYDALEVPIFGSFGKLAFTVENYGGKYSAFSSNYYVKVKKGNTVLDEASGSIAYKLESGEKIKKSVTISGLDYQTSYSTVEIRISWMDEDQSHFTKNYTFYK